MLKKAARSVFSLLVLMALTGQVAADCSAPDVNLPRHEGLAAGFAIEKVTSDVDITVLENDHILVVDFGDYSYLIINEVNNILPVQSSRDTEPELSMLRNLFFSSPDYLGDEKQQFTITDSLLYDLRGDGKAELLFFDVSDGVNIYPGILVRIGEEWTVLIDPECY